MIHNLTLERIKKFNQEERNAILEVIKIQKQKVGKLYIGGVYDINYYTHQMDKLEALHEKVISNC